MKLLLDDASIYNIKKTLCFYPIDGVTTNPSILAKNTETPYDTLKSIQAILGPGQELHVQLLSGTFEEMLTEAEYIVEKLGSEIYIKIPAIPEGYRAIQALTKRGLKTTATTVYSPMQALIAAKAGAAYVAPYVNRIENLGIDGVEMVKKIHDIYVKHAFFTKILAASLKNVYQVQSLCEYGIDAVTVSYDILCALGEHPVAKEAASGFVQDFQLKYGKGKTMLHV